MKKNVIWNILLGLVLFLQLAAEGLTATILLRLNMLPEKYAIVLIAALVLTGGLTAFLMFVRFGKPVGAVRKVFACLLALLIVVGCVLISKLAADAYETMSAVTAPTQTTSIGDMYIFVRTDDPAKKLEDTSGYRFSVIQDHDTEHTENMLHQISNRTGPVVSVTPYATVLEMVDALYAKQVDALILNGSSVALLIEVEGYEDFLEKARILLTIPLTELEATEPSSEPTETTQPEVEKTVTNAPFIMYVSGSDTRSTKLSVSRSDVNILVVVNPVTKQVLLLNTPRDYYIPNPAGNGKLDKLTHCGNYGVECSMEALENLYGAEISYYAQINFSGFEKLIDAVGGVTIYSDQSFTAGEIRVKKGENNFNGEEALLFARERYHVSGGDNGRGKNQMKVIAALIDKATTGTTVISKYSDILASLKGMFKTSMSTDEISELVKMQLDDMATWDVHSFAVTGTGGSEVTYSWPGVRAYVMHPNEDVVDHASELIQRVMDGKILTDEDMQFLN